jgi:hypothetical protein
MWRPYLNHNIKYDKILDHSTDWDLLGVPTYAPLVELKKGRKSINAFSAKFLASRNWQARLVTVFGPMLFTVFATIINYVEILFQGDVSASLSPFFGTEDAYETMLKEQEWVHYKSYFEIQVAVALIAVFIISKTKVKSNSNSLTVSDSFCGVLMLGLVLSLFRVPAVCLTGQFVLGIALIIPIGNFVGLMRAKKKWLNHVKSSNVERPGAKTSKSVDVLSKGDRMFDITNPDHRLHGTVLRLKQSEGGGSTRKVRSEVYTSHQPVESRFTQMAKNVGRSITSQMSAGLPHHKKRRKSLMAAIQPHISSPGLKPHRWTDS